MATTFQKILQNAANKGIGDTRSKEAIDWFRSNVRKSRASSTQLFKEEASSLVNSWTNIGPGRVYLFTYDPKHKKTLPYYDTFPCIIPLERYKDGFLALNLHYLPPVLRARLFDALLDTVNNSKIDENVKMKLSYKILKGVANNKHYKPCIKRYLGKHVRSRFIRVEPDAWAPAIFLPVENFQKASKRQVWADSRGKK